MNAKFLMFFMLTLSMSSVFGDSLTFPEPYKVSKIKDNCVILKSPKTVKGTQICSYSLSASEVAFKSNLFEFLDDTWFLVGSGIPNMAKVRKENDATLLSGETFCQIEDKTGIHTAGAKCYFGMAYVNDCTLTFRSAAIPLSRVKNNSFTGHDIAFIEIAKINFSKNPPHVQTPYQQTIPSTTATAGPATAASSSSTTPK
jgi:hypothetical protein